MKQLSLHVFAVIFGLHLASTALAGAKVIYSVRKDDSSTFLGDPKSLDIEPHSSISIPTKDFNRTCTFKKNGFSQGNDGTITTQYQLDCKGKEDNVYSILGCIQGFAQLPQIVHFQVKGYEHMFTLVCQ